MLTRLSECTGAAYIVIHHAGKPKEGNKDERAQARGSSRIFDPSGCVLQMNKQRDEALVKVTMSKQPAEAAGRGLEGFGLAIEDVPVGNDPAAGVRVVARSLAIAGAHPAKTSAQALRVMQAVSAHPGMTANQVVQCVGIARAEALRLLEQMVRDRILVVKPGARNATHYHPAPEMTVSDCRPVLNGGP